MASFAGDLLSAAQLDNIAGVGEEALNATSDTDSSAWTTSTHVLTNLVGTLTTTNAGIYRVEADIHIQSSGIGYMTAGLAFKQGGAVSASDPLCGGPQTARASESGAVYEKHLSGRFVAAATTTYGVGVVGWVATGGIGGFMRGNASIHINRLYVTRVG